MPRELCPPYEAYDKYIAILCVGTEKMQQSQYVDDVFDEYSVYAFYDYLSDKKPSIDELTQCGFLPCLTMYGKERGFGIETLEWRYKFILLCYSFRVSKNGSEQSIEKCSCLSENERFHSLFVQKNYSSESSDGMELFDVFGDFFELKAKLANIGIEYDNLLDTNKTNPSLRSKDEISKLIQEEIEDEIRNWHQSID